MRDLVEWKGTAMALIILCGAHSDAGTGMIGLCKFSGHLSYPLCTTPFAYALACYSWTRHPSLNVNLTLISLLIPFVIFSQGLS